ncbi:MAG TPA: hypothetical protein VN778_01860 [Verrucomicrobiae bacterium]|nr:hypothetical protein [Verrucomicrobiae bacterium]
MTKESGDQELQELFDYDSLTEETLAYYGATEKAPDEAGQLSLEALYAETAEYRSRNLEHTIDLSFIDDVLPASPPPDRS